MPLPYGDDPRAHQGQSRKEDVKIPRERDRPPGSDLKVWIRRFTAYLSYRQFTRKRYALLLGEGRELKELRQQDMERFKIHYDEPSRWGDGASL